MSGGSIKVRNHFGKIAIVFFLILISWRMTAAGTTPDFISQKASASAKVGLVELPISFLKTEGVTKLILFLDPRNLQDREILSFAHVLSKKYEGRGLRILCVVSGEPFTMPLAFRDRLAVDFFVDKEKKLREALEIGGCCGGTVLLDSGNQVRFRSMALMGKSNLRQLVEKELLGSAADTVKIRFNPELIDSQRILDLPLYEPVSGSINPIRDISGGDFTVLSFFSSLCPSCHAGERNETIKSLDIRLSGNNAKIRWINIFPAYFEPKDITDLEPYLSIPFEKYIAVEDLLSEEDQYLIDISERPDPLTIILNRKNDIIYREIAGLRESEFFNSVLRALSHRR